MALSQMMMVPKNNDFVSSFGVFFSSFLRHWPSAAKTKIFARRRRTTLPGLVSGSEDSITPLFTLSWIHSFLASTFRRLDRVKGFLHGV